MRSRILPQIVAVLMVLLLFGIAPAQAAAAKGTPGPFAGVVAQGQTKSHAFDSLLPIECILPVEWVVTLKYPVTIDTLTLSVGSQTVDGDDGFAQIRFEGACHGQFTISIGGKDVTLVSPYEVRVTSGPCCTA